MSAVPRAPPRFPMTLRLLLSLLAVLSPLLARAEEKLRFNRDIRPILSDACFHCHGPDEKERKGGLRLDLAEKALVRKIRIRPPSSGKGGGKAKWSCACSSTRTSDVMPPPESGKTLTPAQRDTLKRWIEQGAEYEGHWAFENPCGRIFPTEKSRCIPVDAFLAAPARARGTRDAARGRPRNPPAPPFPRPHRTAPTLAEQDAFLADRHRGLRKSGGPAPRLTPFRRTHGGGLARPRPIRRQHGFQSDGQPPDVALARLAHRRHNRNLPFDQFTIEQLAGDLLPDATRDQIIATGFNRNHRLNGEGGRIEAEWFVETVIDRVETTGMTWMALTLNCARCHDHKYDPVSRRNSTGFSPTSIRSKRAACSVPRARTEQHPPPPRARGSAERELAGSMRRSPRPKPR